MASGFSLYRKLAPGTTSLLQDLTGGLPENEIHGFKVL